MFLYIENVYQGSTPLHLACASGHIECVKMLAETNADFTATDGKGKGCMQLAEENWDPLAQWLTTNMRGLRRTYAPGVLKEDRGYRSMTPCTYVTSPTDGHEAQQDW